MPSAWLTNFMASLESPGGMTRQPTTQEIAADIIRKSNRYSYSTRAVGGGLGAAQLSSSKKKLGEKGPSTIQRVMDILSRGTYTTANLIKEGIKDAKSGDILGALSHAPIGVGALLNADDAWAGLSGKKKTTARDIYKTAGMGEGKGVGGFARNLATDILIDPLTFIPGGAIASAVRGAKKGTEAAQVLQKAGTASERVERALNDPVNILARSSSNKTIPNVRGLDKTRVAAVGRTKAPVEVLDPIAARLKTTSSSRTIPQQPRRVKLFDEVPAPVKAFKPEKATEILAKIVPIDTPLPKRIAATKKAVPFKLDVSKIAAIEIGRALKPRGATVEDYTVGKKLLDENGTVPVYGLSGKETGQLNSAGVHEYLRTGKVDAPKESEIPEFGKASEEEMQAFFSRTFADKNDPKNLYIKNVDAEGNETLVSLAEVRKRIVLTKKSKKLKDEIPNEVEEVIDELPVTEDFQIADAEDIVDAVGEGSQTAAKAMAEAVEAQAPRTRQLIDERGGRAVSKVAEKYIELVRAGTFKNTNFNPAKQANAFRELEKELVEEGLLSGFTKIPKERIITASTGKVATARRSVAMKHLEALEDAMTAAGHPPMTFGKNGYPVRMSDLINAAGGIHTVLAPKNMHLTDLFGTQKKLDDFLAANPEAAQLAAKSQAAHAAYSADLIDKGKSAALAAGHKLETDPSKTAAEIAEGRTSLPQVARDVVEAEASIPNPEAARMAAANVREILEDAKPPVHRVAERYAKAFDKTVFSGKVGKETVVGSVAKDRAALGVAGVPVDGIKSEISRADDALASQGLMASLLSKFKPDFRQEDLRPIFVENRSLFQTQTARWSHALNQTWKKYPKPVRLQAFSALQKGTPVGDDITAAAAREFQNTMESMFGASGLKSAVETDVLREAITMDDLNKALRMRHSKFQFVDTVKDEIGNDVKVPWLDSWKYHDLKGQDPIEFIKEMRDAVDKTLLEKSIFDQLAIWGKTGGRTQFAHPRLEGVEFPAEIKPQVAQFLKVMEEVANPGSKLGFQYDTALRLWKSGVTIYSPSHHIRNMVGDITLAWFAGVNNPRVYSKAASVLKSNRNLYSDMTKVDDLVGKGSEARALSRQAKVPIVRTAGRQLDAEQVYTIMYKRGLLPHSKTIEDIPTGVQEFKLPQPLGGRGKKVARGTSETREHFVRTAHFIDALGKSKAKSIDEAIDEATRITRKWHPDGLDLTDFEHRYMRRVFPFYSWVRKAIPLMLEGAVKRPAKITAPNKALYNLQISMGIDPESLSEPFPVDKEFPDWIRDMAYGPVLGGGSHILGANLNPVTSVTEQLGNDPRRGLAGMLTPAVRIPGEIMSQSDWQTGQPMESMDKTEYIDKQIPLVSIANRLSGGNLATGSVEALATGNSDAMFNHKKAEGTGGNTQTKDAFLNYLLAAGIINTQTPANLKSAEFDRADRIKKERERMRK